MISAPKARAPQGGAEAVNALSANAANASINAVSADAGANTIQNSEVKVTSSKTDATEAVPTIEELTRALRSCFAANCQWLCGQITTSLPPGSIMEAFAKALNGTLYSSPLKDFKFAVAGERCIALVNVIERKYDGTVKVTNVKTARRL